MLKKKRREITAQLGRGVLVPLYRTRNGEWAPLQRGMGPREQAGGQSQDGLAPLKYPKRKKYKNRWEWNRNRPLTIAIDAPGTIGEFIKNVNSRHEHFPLSREALKLFFEKASSLHIRLLTSAGIEKIEEAVRGNPELMKLWEKRKREA